MGLPDDMTWKRSKVLRYDLDGELLGTHRRARFVIQSGSAMVFHDDTAPTTTAVIDDGDKISTRQVVLTTTDGERWVVNQMGCGCGGS